MKENKRINGFTLIELLAIIVIIAVIAVITVPIVLNIIENAKKGAAVSSAYGYTDSIAKNYLSKAISGDDMQIKDSMFDVSDIEELGIKFNGSKPTDGWVYYSGNKISDSCLVIDGYKVYYQDGKFKSDGKGSCSFVEDFSTDDLTPGVICGNGTSEDYDNSSVCYIDSVEDLVEFSNMVLSGKNFSGKSVLLTSNLDFSNIESYASPDLNQFGDINGDGTSSETLYDELNSESGKGFRPIGDDDHRFSGIFDGGLYKIKNLYVNRTTSYYVGLFGYNSGTIKGLILENSDIRGKKFVGSIAGQNNGTISSVMVINGNIIGSSIVGLAVGENDSASLECVVSGDVSVPTSLFDGDPYVGGIAGEVYRGNAKGVYLSGSVDVKEGSFTGNYAKLAVASGYSASLSNVVSSSVLYNGSAKSSNSLSSTDGFIVNPNSLNSIALIDSAIDTYIGGDNNHDDYYYDFDKKGKLKLYSIDDNPLVVTLDRVDSNDENSPYIVKSYNDLKQVSYDLSGSYVLDDDIDFNGKNPFAIATKSNSFTGTFNGNGHALNNISIIGENNVGLFGSNSGTVRDFSLDNVYVSGNESVGTIAGYNTGTIKGISISGADVFGKKYVGGIVGQNTSTGSLTTTIFAGDVTGDTRIALACGDNDEGTIQSVVSGNLKVNSDSTESNVYAGAIVGANYKGNLSGAFISGSIDTRPYTTYVHRMSGYDYFNCVTSVALDSIEINGNTSSSTGMYSQDGKSYSSEALLTSTPYEQVGLNFTEDDSSVKEYIWYFDNGSLKFSKN